MLLCALLTTPRADSARFAGDSFVPKWYPRLRRPLTFTAMTATGVCLGVLWGDEMRDAQAKKASAEIVSEFVEDADQASPTT